METGCGSMPANVVSTKLSACEELVRGCELIRKGKIIEWIILLQRRDVYQPPDFLIIYFQAGAFITSSLCGMTVGACYSFLILYFCEFSCGPENAVAVIVCILSIVQCIAGCSSCYCVAFSSSQVTTNIKTSVCNFIPREFVLYSLDYIVYVCNLL